METITDIPLMQEAVESCHYFWKAGWGEFHAGNLSYLLSEEELAELAPYFRPDPIRVPVEFDTCGLEGRCFLATRSGGQFRTLPRRVERDMGIIRVLDGAYEILWGYDGGAGRPTSELPAHLLCHAARLGCDPGNRIVMHCHPTYLNAMTTIADMEEHAFTKALWSLNSECILVFPDGVGTLPWMVCGEGPIGPATAEKMRTYRVVVWPCHGMFASGGSFDEVIGLIEAIEKNAQVYVSVNGQPKNVISDRQLEELAAHFGLKAQVRPVAEGEVPIADLIDERLMLFDIDASSKEDLIRQMAQRAEEAGYVVPGYADDVIERELSYPTALPTPVMKVAVPHAMVQDHVLKSTIVAARLAHPVTFKEMGDGINDVEVEMAFMLVAKGDKHHLKVLQKLIMMIADSQQLEVIKGISEPAAMASELLARLS